MSMDKLRPENYRGDVIELDEHTFDFLMTVNYCVALIYNPTK